MSKYMGQIMAECGCERKACEVRGCMAERIQELEAELAKAVEALDEAVYLLGVTEEDIAKGAGVYRIVNTLKELTGEGGTHDKNL
jgi:hypothetical protein